MWVDHEAEVRTRMRDRVREAERQRLAAHARAGRAGARRPPAGHGWRLRQAPPWGSPGPLRGLVRTGLRLLDTRRA
jgi:hypothetical protein